MSHSVDSVLQTAKRLHFVGIGGSGMFPIVEILSNYGYRITGSDVNEGSIIDRERAMGIPVSIGHHADNIEGADALVITAALLDGNPEVARAIETSIPVLDRADVLGWITRRYSKAVCVSGTHGKTTTTAMLVSILLSSGLDPAAVIGGKLPLIDGYGRSGKTDYMVCEACEFRDTFLRSLPWGAVILNIDADHLDYFKTVENLRHSFLLFAESATGYVLANGDDLPCRETLACFDKKPLYFFGEAEDCDFRITDVENYERAFYRFTLSRKNGVSGRFTLKIPGLHNVHNAAAAVASALLCGATVEQIQNGLDTFHGAGRRFEILGAYDGVTIADDYAHHPAELSVTLDAARSMGYDRVIAVFQPFTFSRTHMLLDDFAAALKKADLVVLTEIMGAREINTSGITTEALSAKIPRSVWFKSFEEVSNHCLSIAQPGDLILTLGCGDIYKAANRMVKICKSRN